MNSKTSTNEDDPNIYEMEEIVDKRKEETISYFIKWKGYDSSQNTWEQTQNIFCNDMIEDYEKREKEIFKDYSSIFGLDTQIIQLENNIVLPLTNRKKFSSLKIPKVKGVLLYGPTGNGKSSLVEACAKRSKSNIVNIDCDLLVRMSTDNAVKTIRDAFRLAMQHAPAIVLIDNLSETGIKGYNVKKHGDVEVNLCAKSELLYQIENLSIDTNIKLIAESNRVDLLDHAFLESGRFNYKIEVPRPNLEARELLLEYYGQLVNTSSTVNFKDLSVVTCDFSAAQCKTICENSKIIAERRDSRTVNEEDLLFAISQEKQ